MKLKKLKKTLFKIPQAMASHAFFSCLVLFLLALFIGFGVFYKYNNLIQSAGPDDSESLNMLDYQKYNKVLERWEEDEERSRAIDSKEYPNPFIPRNELTEEEI